MIGIVAESDWRNASYCKDLELPSSPLPVAPFSVFHTSDHLTTTNPRPFFFARILQTNTPITSLNSSHPRTRDLVEFQ
jgi:hypothetical protein